jgi:hypothetical protein
MKKKLLLLLAVASTCFALPYSEGLQDKAITAQDNHSIDMASIVNTDVTYIKPTPRPSAEIKAILHEQAPTLSAAVINKVSTTLMCANEHNVEHSDILTVIDYSLPSSEKRLWVFDLKEKKLLFNTYVSHGINSGVLSTQFFSNKNNSKASSMGVYRTDKSYHGRHGLSLQLEGLDRGFNDNASRRAVVMHGGWYVEERFIKKYGRAGRSWGCPAVPDELSASIINTIKQASLFVVYYPSDNWLLTSKFQTCERLSPVKNIVKPDPMPVSEDKVHRDDILYVDINKNNKREENDPIVVMTADNYQQTFHTKPPLERMLRRQINNEEYIALSNGEFKDMVANNGTGDINRLSTLYFVIPVVKMQRGYYATEMEFVKFGKIKEVTPNTSLANEPTKAYSVSCELKSSVNLRTTNTFIRWLGL